jgi:hypothetical protein
MEETNLATKPVAESPAVAAVPPPLWRYNLASDYDTPAQPTTQKVKTGLSSFWHRLALRKSPSQRREENAEYQPLSESLLRETLPESHWDVVAASLADGLSPWMSERKPASLFQAVIGPPGSGVHEAVTLWGSQLSAKLLTPPEPERLLKPEPGFWQSATGDAANLLVIPQLERFFLRHSEGLALIRQLVEWLWATPRRVVVGCDSWAWAYLSKTVQIDAVFRNPIALEAMDGKKLWEWFRPRPRGRYVVQTAWNGEVIYPIEIDQDGSNKLSDIAEPVEHEYKGEALFQWIAATSRGIPGVALPIWRECLCEGDAGTQSKEQTLNPGHNAMRIRVRAPEDLDLPLLPSGASTREAIILHTILLHAGLPISILAQIVPFTVTDTISLLSKLGEAALIYESDGIWSVNPLAYSHLRSFIRAESFLIDAF